MNRTLATTFSLAILLAANAWGQAAGQAAPGQGAPPAQSAPPPASAPAKTVTVTTSPGSAGPQAKRGRRAAAPPVVPQKPAWEQFKLNPKTTMYLDFTDANPDMIISMMARTAGITILKDPTFKDTLTVQSAKSVHLGDAFEIFNTVLNLHGYELKKQGKLMVVGKNTPPPPPQMPMQMPPPAPPPDDKPIVKVYALKNANAQQVARVVNEVFTAQQLEQLVQQLQQGGGFQGNPQGGGGRFPGGGPGGPPQAKIVRASSEDYSNSVVVNAPKTYQEDVEKLIKELDKSSDQPLVSEIFKLQYVNVSEVVDAVQEVLSSNAPLGRGAGKGQDNQNQNPFFFNPFGNNSSRKSGGQTALAIKQTNSLIVSATAENMATVKKLLENLDQPNAFVGTTFVVHLQNAKASDVATLLNQAFTQRRDVNQDNPFFFFFGGGSDPNQKNQQPTDMDETGKVVNVRDLTGKVNVIADPNTNSLIVVTLPSNMPLIQRIVDKIDSISEQVMIETIIVEANLDKTTQLGVEWNLLQGKVLNVPTTSATTSTNFGLQSSTTPLQGLSYLLTGNAYKAFLNTLQTDSRFKVLSTPRIFTSNNVKSEINVSTSVPYITSQQSGVIGNLISNYDFKDVGVVLTVTPRITSSGQVAMDVIQKADDLQGFTTFNAPIINHRQATTTVSVNDGDTIILGGIIRTTKSLTENKIPLLGDIPLLGNLFKSSTNTVNQVELLVLLTPHIVRNAEEARKLREEQTKKLSKESQGEIKHEIHPGG